MEYDKPIANYIWDAKVTTNVFKSLKIKYSELKS